MGESRWGRGAVGSAPRWHRGGRGFESHRLHQRFATSLHVYILQSQTTNHYYVGQTLNIQARLAYHNAGRRFGRTEAESDHASLRMCTMGREAPLASAMLTFSTG